MHTFREGRKTVNGSDSTSMSGSFLLYALRSTVMPSIRVKIVEWCCLIVHSHVTRRHVLIYIITNNNIVWITCLCGVFCVCSLDCRGDVSDDESTRISAVLLMFGSVPGNTWGELTSFHSCKARVSAKKEWLFITREHERGPHKLKEKILTCMTNRVQNSSFVWQQFLSTNKTAIHSSVACTVAQWVDLVTQQYAMPVDRNGQWWI